MVNLLLALMGIVLLAFSAYSTVLYMKPMHSISSADAAFQLVQASSIIKKATLDLYRANTSFNPSQFGTSNLLNGKCEGRNGNPQPDEKVKISIANNELCLSPTVMSLLPGLPSLKFMSDLGPNKSNGIPSVSIRWIPNTNSTTGAFSTVGQYIYNDSIGALCFRPDTATSGSSSVPQGFNVDGRALIGMIEGVKQLNGGELKCTQSNLANCTTSAFVYFTDTLTTEIDCYSAIIDLNTTADNALTNGTIDPNKSYKAVFALGV